MFKHVEHYSTFTESRRITKEFVHTWKVNDFKSIHPSLENYISALGAYKGQTVWDLLLYPDGVRTEDQEYIGMYVYFCEHTIKVERKLPYLFLVYLIDKDDKERQMYKSEDKKLERNIPRLVKKCDVLDENNGLLPNGNLIIRLKMFFKEDVVESPESMPVTTMENNSRYDRLENMFNQEKYSDVKLVVDDKEFWAYKGILANRSEVFEAMFAHDMVENANNKVEITDTDHEIVLEMLRYIYIGKVENIEKIAGDLLAVAEKYQLKDLKLICEETLITALSVETVTSLLVLAENHGAKLLKQAALNFFKLHAKEIVVNDKYKNNFESIVPVLSEIIERLVL